VKEIVMMIHGMWGNDGVWVRFKQYFEAAGYSCITPVLRFHSMKTDSPPSAALGRTSLLDYAQDLENEISVMASKPIIMGHSMGGLLAQILAAKGLAKSLVLLAPSPAAGLVKFSFSAGKLLLSEITRPGFWNMPVRLTYKEAAFGLFNLCPDELKRQLYKECIFESGRATFETAFWYLDCRKASSVDQKKVTCPIMIIVGKEDRATPVTVVRRIAEKYQTVTSYKELDHHAHWLPAEPGWEDIAGMIKDWLKSATA
jgi:pimeloyl-ACP methyl ester carboxylesterase